jgi:hypothetical protein
MCIPLEYNGALDGTLWDGVFMAEKKQLETVLMIMEVLCLFLVS